MQRTFGGVFSEKEKVGINYELRVEAKIMYFEAQRAKKRLLSISEVVPSPIFVTHNY
jgi:hypothetical protein